MLVDGIAGSWVAGAAATGAAALGVWLAVRSWGAAGLPGCGAGSGCDAVTRGRWSRVGPVPVAVVGAVVYIGLLLAAMTSAGFLGPHGRIADALVTDVALVVIGAAAWFTLLQAFVIRQLCAYCVTVHLLACAAAVALLMELVPWRSPGWHAEAEIATACMAVLIVGQLLLAPKTFAVTSVPAAERGLGPDDAAPIDRPDPGSVTTLAADAPPSVAVPKSSPAGLAVTHRRVPLLGGQVVLNTAGWPLLGRTDARHVVAFVFDFTCKECNHLRRLLAAAVDARPDWLAVALVPVPLHPSCNPTVTCIKSGRAQACDYARLAWAVWLSADNNRFCGWDEYVRSEAEGQPYGLAMSRARELAERGGFRLWDADPRLDRAVGTGVGLYRAAGKPRVPALLLPASVLQGHVPDLPALLRALDAQLPSTGDLPATTRAPVAVAQS